MQKWARDMKTVHSDLFITHTTSKCQNLSSDYQHILRVPCPTLSCQEHSASCPRPDSKYTQQSPTTSSNCHVPLGHERVSCFVYDNGCLLHSSGPLTLYSYVLLFLPSYLYDKLTWFIRTCITLKEKKNLPNMLCFFLPVIPRRLLFQSLAQ